MRSRSNSPNDDEDFVGDSPPQQRVRTQSRRLRDATSNAMEERANQEIRQARAVERENTRIQNRAAAATVEQPGDSDKVQRLRALLHATQAERDAAERELAAIQAQPERPDVSNMDDKPIPRPSRISNVSIGLLRRHMYLEGPEHDIEWARIRSVVRDYLRAGRIQWDLRWKEQPTRRLSKIYDAACSTGIFYSKQLIRLPQIEEQLPTLRHFQNSWATEYLAKSAFSSHKTYDACKNDGSKYCGKIKRVYKNAVARQKQRARAPVSDSDSGEEMDADSLE